MSLLSRPATADPRRPVGTQTPAMRELRLLTWLPIVGAAALLGLSLGAPTLAAEIAVPLAVVGALVGIPHGAVDHLVPLWWGNDQSSQRVGPRRSTTSRLVLFAAAYTACAGAALTALLLAPTPMLVAFLLLSAVHFGLGEVVTSAERAGRPVTRTPGERLVAGAHGAVVVGLLFWSRPETTDPYLRTLSPWLADAATRSRGVGLLLVAATVTMGLVVLLRARRRLEAAELALLAGLFSTAPPLAAFGIYFGLWHSLRHTGRLLDLARRRLAAPGWRPAVVLLGRAGLWPSTVAFAAVAALWFARDLASLQAEIAVLLALTFPHSAVVWALDRRGEHLSAVLRPAQR